VVVDEVDVVTVEVVVVVTALVLVELEWLTDVDVVGNVRVLTVLVLSVLIELKVEPRIGGPEISVTVGVGPP
jgi:hypothetical protein